MTTRRDVNFGLLASVAAISAAGSARAAQTIDLPAPTLQGGKSLMQALKDRKSIRDYADRPLSNQVLSNLLWAAWGVNRPQIDGRTAPHWHNVYALDIYLTRADGVWIYEPVGHLLTLHIADDLRAKTTTGQDFVGTAPLNLVYVYDVSKLTPATETEKIASAAACTAVVAQNVYLYCASEGLATVLRQSVPGETLAKTLKVAPSQIIQFAQTVGYPRA